MDLSRRAFAFVLVYGFYIGFWYGFRNLNFLSSWRCWQNFFLFQKCPRWRSFLWDRFSWRSRFSCSLKQNEVLIHIWNNVSFLLFLLVHLLTMLLVDLLPWSELTSSNILHNSLDLPLQLPEHNKANKVCNFQNTFQALSIISQALEHSLLFCETYWTLELRVNLR